MKMYTRFPHFSLWVDADDSPIPVYRDGGKLQESNRLCEGSLL